MECFAITLPYRLHIVKKLENDIQYPITIFDAISGLSYLDKYEGFTHILIGKNITEGMIGCLESHIQILKNSKENVLIFEDDCEFVSNSVDFFPLDFDIMCLGTNENVEFELLDGKHYLRVFRFWGTHALILRESAVKAVLETYEKYAKQKIFLPADWLYSYAIKEYNLKAYAPINPKQYFKQQSGLVSTVNGNLRD
jgi:hypothetical protein